MAVPQLILRELRQARDEERPSSGKKSSEAAISERGARIEVLLRNTRSLARRSA